MALLFYLVWELKASDDRWQKRRSITLAEKSERTQPMVMVGGVLFYLCLGIFPIKGVKSDTCLSASSGNDMPS